MRVKLNNREVEITEFSVGRHFDEVCVEAANYTDGAMEDLNEDELDQLQEDYGEELIQDARESAADNYHDLQKEGWYD